MKKEYLKDVLDTLEHEVPALRWIDANEGQLDFYTDERPPVAFPCCLVDLAMPDVRRLSAMGTTPSRCTLRATLQVAFNDCASLNARTSAGHSTDAGSTISSNPGRASAARPAGGRTASSSMR